MSVSAGNTKYAWLIGGVLLAGLVALAYVVSDRARVEVPQADLSAMEPRVAARIRTYGAAVKSEPESAEAWARLGQAFHAHDLFTQAIASYDRAMELQPDDWRWPYLSALARAETDPRASLLLFRQALDLNPTGAAIHINHGNNLLRLGQNDAAAQAFGRALSIEPESSHALYGLAQVALGANDPQTAVDLLKQAKSASPRHGENYSLLAQAYGRLGDQEAAQHETMLAQASPGTTRAPDPVAQSMQSQAVDSQSISRAGVLLAQRQEYAEAEARFREVLATRQGNARDYANLGGALAGQGRFEEAVGAYRRGLKIDPADVDTLNNLGYTLLQLGHLDEAERQLNKALEIDATFAPALGNVGLLAQRRQQQDMAISYLRRAVEANPGLVFARTALAVQLAIAGDNDGAIEEWQTVLEINPQELAALYNLAATEASRGGHAAAIDYLRRGMAIAPNSSRLVAALAWELATAPQDELRNGDEAMQLALRVYRAFPNQPRIADVMAAVLAETGDFDNAAKIMGQLVASGGEDAETYATRLKAYRQQRPWRQVPSARVKASALLQDH